MSFIHLIDLKTNHLAHLMNVLLTSGRVQEQAVHRKSA